MSLQEHRKNDEITAPKVRLIDIDGEVKGIVALAEAKHLADEEELDLVEIQPNAEPPVCKIMNYDKFRYEQQKKASLAKKHQKQIETKEMQFRPVISQHDYETKLNHVRQFLEAGNKVRIVVRFKARERGNHELGATLVEKLLLDLKDDAQLDTKSLRSAESQFLVLATPLPKPTKNSAMVENDVEKLISKIKI